MYAIAGWVDSLEPSHYLKNIIMCCHFGPWEMYKLIYKGNMDLFSKENVLRRVGIIVHKNGKHIQ